MAEKRDIFIEKPLDYSQILFRRINECCEAKTMEDYIIAVENLSDFMSPYWDKQFFKALELNGESVPDLSNQMFEGMPIERQRDYARKLFRELINLVHRSGFMPLKEFFEVWE